MNKSSRRDIIKSLYSSKYKTKDDKIINIEHKEDQPAYEATCPTDTDILDELSSMPGYFEAHFHTESINNNQK